MNAIPGGGISVVIVDDEALVRQGLTLILEAVEDIRVLGVGDGGDAERLVRELRPDVVLLDIRMPHPDGLTVLRALRALAQPPRVVMLTTFDMDDYVRTAIDLGASGYLLKDTDPEQLPHFVRAAAAGGVVLAPAPARRMRDAVRTGGADPAASELIATLTDRELAVLGHVARGGSNAEIALAMHLSVGTVKDHVSTVLAKLGVTGRVTAALVAERAGFLEAGATR